MRIVFIAAGAGGMYCGSCLRDNALCLELRDLGHELLMAPVYTPMRVDEESAADERVHLGALDVYLQQKLPRLRGRRGVLGRILGSQAVLRFLSRFALGASPEEMGALTVSMLRGEEGNQRRSVEELCGFLGGAVRPEVVHLTNALLCGLAGPLGRATGAPVVCGLQGEDLFLDGLPAAHREAALALVRTRGSDVRRFIATSRAYADKASGLFGIDRSRIDVVLSGIRTADYAAPPEPRPPGPIAIGYLARISPEKGLHVLVEAFERLVRSGSAPGARLIAGGYLGGKAGVRYAAAIRRWLAARGIRRQVEILGTLDRSQKVDLLRRIDVFCVPTTYPDAKGIFALEAMACGVPIVAPDHGAFPEIVEATGGGLLHAPDSAEDLASKLETLCSDADLRRRLGSKGRESVLERHTARGMAEATVRIYQEVAGA